MLNSNDIKTLSLNDITQTNQMLATLKSKKLLKFALIYYI